MGELNSVVIQHQHQDQWCWAAVTQAVCQYFGNVTTQEDIVSRTLNNPGCISAPGSCDSPFPLRFALQALGRFDDQNGVLSFADIQQQIDTLARPLAITVSFNGPLGETSHYCLIKGCSTVGGLSQITVLDPAPENGAESRIAYDDLCSGVTMGGSWTESFTVK